MAEPDTKQSQVLSDLASFYASNANFDFTPPGSPVKVTPPTSDSEQEKQPVVIQRNVFISSQDVASRRRRTKPGAKSSTTATASSTANSSSNLNTAPLSPLAEGESNDVAGSRRSRRRHGPSNTTSASTPASKHESDKPSSSTSLQREAQRTNPKTTDTTIPLQSESGNTGSALDKLKRRAASSERSGIPKGSMSSRRVFDESGEMGRSRRGHDSDGRRGASSDGIPKGSISSRRPGDESGEMGRSRRGHSSDGRRRARRSTVQDESNPTEPSATTKDRAAPDRARSNDSLHDMNTSRQGESRGEGSGENRRSLPSRSRSNDDALLEMDTSRSGEHRRMAPGRSRSNDDALLVDMDVSRSGEHRRMPSRRRSSEDVLQVDDDSKGSGRRRRSRALSDEETPEKPLSSTISSSEHSNETGKSSDAPRVRRAAKGTSPLDMLKNATNEVIGEGGGTTSKRSGWSNVKHGMDFINKAKAATEENRTTTSSRRQDHERRRHRTERQSREVSRSPSKSPERANGDGPSETPAKKATNGTTEGAPRSPKKNTTERRRHGSPKRDHKTESSTSSGSHSHKHSRGRGNSKWSAMKERSLSRGQSADRLEVEDGHERSGSSRPRRSRRSADTTSSNEHESHKVATAPISYPSPIAEQPSPKVSSEIVGQNLPEPNLVEASDIQPPAENDTSSSKKSSIFKSLLMGKSKSKKSEEPPADSRHPSQTTDISEEKPDQPADVGKDEVSSDRVDANVTANPAVEANQAKPEADGAEKPSSDSDLGKKKKSMLKKLLHKSSFHGEDPGTTLEWSRSKPQAGKTENTADESHKKSSMLKKLLSTGSSKKEGEEGESKKKHSAWGGIKSSMEFTSKLMKVTGDKKHKEKEKVVIDPLADVPDETFQPKKETSSTPPDTNDERDEDTNQDGPVDGLDYGLMASVASFSAEAIEGLDELDIQETIQEDEGSETSDDNDAPSSFRSTKSNEVAAVLSAADDDNVDAFALFSGAMNASSSSLPGERPSMAGLRAPSQRLDLEPKVDKPSTRAASSVGMIIEEGDEDEDEEEEEEESVADPVAEPVQLDRPDDEEVNVDEENDDCGILDEEEVSESSSEPVALLSPLKVIQLSFGALSKHANAELSVSVHRLTEETKYQEGANDMCIHGTMGKGVKYDTASCYSSEEESNLDEDDFAEHDVDAGEPVQEDNDDTDDMDENTLTIDCSISPEMQLEYMRLQSALEASIVRAKAARDEIRALQLELQSRRTCFGEIEKSRQQSLKELQVHKVAVKR